jgi:hypothetical protein
MSQQLNSLLASKEARLKLASKAIKRNATLSIPRAAAIYNVAKRTLRRRRTRTPSQRDCTPNSIKLLKTEENVIVQHILDLDARGFAPRLTAVKDIANSLLAKRHRDPISQN